MKITITSIKETQVEISFPCYVKSKSGNIYYKCESETKCIQVSDFEYNLAGIQFVGCSIAFQDGFSIIQKKEYDTAFANVLKKLSL